ncbi:MAG: polymer-forming cytoskeletal protein [Desulfotalea sp.]
MFSKSEKTESKLKKIDSEVIASIIDKSMTINGEIVFKGKTRIDGVVNGNIKGDHLILSESGSIKGDIESSSFSCFGKQEGNITTDILTARKGCYMTGKIIAKSLTVEPGAQIEGEIKAALSNDTAKHSTPNLAKI